MWQYSLISFLFLHIFSNLGHSHFLCGIFCRPLQLSVAVCQETPFLQVQVRPLTTVWFRNARCPDISCHHVSFFLMFWKGSLEIYLVSHLTNCCQTATTDENICTETHVSLWPVDFYWKKISLLRLYWLTCGPSCDRRIPENNLPYLHKRPQVCMLLLSAFCIGVSITWMVFRNEDQWVWRQNCIRSTYMYTYCSSAEDLSSGYIVYMRQSIPGSKNRVFLSHRSNPAILFIWVIVSSWLYNWKDQNVDLIHVLTPLQTICWQHGNHFKVSFNLYQTFLFNILAYRCFHWGFMCKKTLIKGHNIKNVKLPIVFS